MYSLNVFRRRDSRKEAPCENITAAILILPQRKPSPYHHNRKMRSRVYLRHQK